YLGRAAIVGTDVQVDLLHDGAGRLESRVDDDRARDAGRADAGVAARHQVAVGQHDQTLRVAGIARGADREALAHRHRPGVELVDLTAGDAVGLRHRLEERVQALVESR